MIHTAPVNMIKAVGMLVVASFLSSCSEEMAPQAKEVPSGYVQRLEIEKDDRRITFGPLIGYYFKPVKEGDLSRLNFITYNERSHYTRDLSENAKLFEGEALLQTLVDDVDFIIPADDRVNAVKFSDAPPVWVQNRPEPQNEFVYFRSCYDASGSVLTGYWLRHVGTASYTYDMGGRLGPESSLHHEVTPGVDTSFARMFAFDKGWPLEKAPKPVR